MKHMNTPCVPLFLVSLGPAPPSLSLFINTLNTIVFIRQYMFDKQRETITTKTIRHDF